MEKLLAKEIDLLKGKKYPGLSYSLLINTTGIVFTILLWMLYLLTLKKGYDITLISQYKIHFIFPLLLWGLFYGISAILNIKINKDLKYKEKIVEIRKIKETKYNRRFPFFLRQPDSNRAVVGNVPEYRAIFDDNTVCISNSPIKNAGDGNKFKISKAKYSRIVVAIEPIEE